MSTIRRTPERSGRTNPLASAQARKAVDLTHSTWHAAWLTGSAVNAVAGFTNPPSTACDRVPEFTLGAGTPGEYTVVGTYDGETVTRTITTVAGSTVKLEDANGNPQPLDAVTSVTGPDPGATLTMYWGDLVIRPEAQALWTGTDAGDVDAQLVGDAASSVSTYPSERIMPLAIKWIGRASTTLQGAEIWW